MGKNNKVLLDNGKQASSSMQLYWNKAKQIEKKKQEQRKKDFKERTQSEIKNKESGQKQGNGEDEEGNFMSREAMNNIMKEKERRRQGQYSSKSEDVLTEANILNAQKALTNKNIKIPGYSSDFISSQQIERNKQEIEKRKLFAQAARDRKEQREKQEKQGGEQSGQIIQKPDATEKPQQNPNQANKPPFNNQNQNFKQHHQNFQNRHYQNRQREQESSDPLFKVTEQEDYNPVQEMIKQQQLQQQKQQNQNQLGASYYQPPPPPNMPPFPSGMMPPPSGMFPLPPGKMPPTPNMPPPQIQDQTPFNPPFYQQQPQITQQNKNKMPPPPMLVPQPVVVQGESTVKKSKIDLTQKKQQFVPRNLVIQQGQGNNVSKTENKQAQQPEALGGNIQNISQAPAPQPFLQGGQDPFVSNLNNQDLLKQFLQDIEKISKIQNNESS
ncbi:hypothetical protein ABPG72_001950 [Tetrahymena utriculariae]